VLEGVGPLTAVQRSASALKTTWGETLILAERFGAVGSFAWLTVNSAMRSVMNLALDALKPAFQPRCEPSESPC